MPDFLRVHWWMLSLLLASLWVFSLEFCALRSPHQLINVWLPGVHVLCTSASEHCGEESVIKNECSAFDWKLLGLTFQTYAPYLSNRPSSPPPWASVMPSLFLPSHPHLDGPLLIQIPGKRLFLHWACQDQLLLTDKPLPAHTQHSKPVPHRKGFIFYSLLISGMDQQVFKVRDYFLCFWSSRGWHLPDSMLCINKGLLFGDPCSTFYGTRIDYYLWRMLHPKNKFV